MRSDMPPRLGPLTRLAYAIGGVAYGVKGNGFSYFLMFCYSQAFGLPPRMVGIALLLAFLLDAFSDPVVGFLSDNTRSRFGRRHLFMYAAILPVGVAYYMLWNPPADLGQLGLFWYLVGFAVGVRFLITFYEVPCTALSAELTRDYDARTSLLTQRAVLVYFGGVIMAATTLGFILQERDGASAFTDAAGFGTYGAIGALVIMASMLVCSLGTRHFVPHLTRAHSVPASFRDGLREVWQTLSTPSLAALFGSQLAGFAAFGISSSLIYYLQGYFWEFTSTQSSIITACVLLSALLALAIGPNLSRRFGKRFTAFSLGAVALVLSVGPVTLRLMGLMPENGTPVLFWTILVITTLDYACIIAMNATVSAMFSDLVEDAELRSGKRSEGLLFSVMTFTRKSVEGIGVLSASIILAFIAFPEGASPGEVGADTVFRLGAFYAPAVFLFWALMLVFISRYRISRQDHEQNLAMLAARAAAEQEDAGPHY